MKVRKLYKKYKGYNIRLYGRPLDKPTIPFSYLPISKEEQMDMKVVDMKIKEKEETITGVHFSNMKKFTQTIKGTIDAYIEKEEL